MGKVQVFFCVSSLGSVGDIKLIAWWVLFVILLPGPLQNAQLASGVQVGL